MKQNADKKTQSVVYTIAVVLVGVFLIYGIMYKFPSHFQETITKIENFIYNIDQYICFLKDIFKINSLSCTPLFLQCHPPFRLLHRHLFLQQLHG